MQSIKQNSNIHKKSLFRVIAVDKKHLLQVMQIVRQVFVFAFGMLSANGTIFGTFTPFAFALTLGMRQSDMLMLAAGAIVQAFLWQTGTQTTAIICTLLAIIAVRWVLPKSFVMSSLAAGLTLVGVNVAFAWSGVVLYGAVFISLVNTAIAIGLAWLIKNHHPEKEKIGTLAFSVIVIIALASLPVQFSWSAIALVSAVGAMLALRGKEKESLFCAIAFAIALPAGSSNFLFAVVGVLLSSVLALCFGSGDKARVAILYLIGGLVSPFVVGAELTSALNASFLYSVLYMGSVASGVLAFLVTPQSLIIREEQEVEQIAKRLQPTQVAAANRLDAVAQSFSDIASTVRNVHDILPRKTEDFNWVVERMQSSLCDNCSKHEQCWGKRYSETITALFELKPILQQTEHVGVENLPLEISYCVYPAALASEMTRAYALYRSACASRVHSESLRAALTEQYGAVADALTGLSSQLGEVGLPEYYKTRRVADFFEELGIEVIECAVTQETLGRMRATITLTHTGFSEKELHGLKEEVTRICNRAMEFPQKLSCRGVTTLIFSEKATLRPVFGKAYKAAKGEVSGDAVQQFCLVNSAEMILCDGMGTGHPAAIDGMLAAELTARLLKVGFTAQTAARLVNVALALKSDEESSATLDLFSIDLYTGKSNIFKAGAVPSFVVQNGKAKTMGAVSLPVGILGEVMGESLSVRLQTGDMAVLVSDGMLLDGSAWIIQQLELSIATRQTPQEIANILVETATLRAKGRAKADDITVAIMKLEKA